jgi:hypothetical protein
VSRHLRRAVIALGACLGALSPSRAALAHDGPPFPIVSNQTVGPYQVSIWTDPDTTDDGTPGGQFWVYVHPAGGEGGVPAGTGTTVSIRPLDREGPTRTSAGAPVEGRASQYFAAVLMDHEGRFRVDVVVEGPLGRAAIASEVEGTYDARPPAILLVLYVMPFALVGFLWIKRMRQRRQRVVL